MNSIEKVFNRLKRNFPDFLESDYDLIKKDIAEMLNNGYSEDQVYRYTKNREEVNPDLDEETALKRMKAVREEL